MTHPHILSLHDAAMSFVQIVQDTSDPDRAIEIAQRINRVVTGEKKPDTWLAFASLIAALLLQLPEAERRSAMAGFALLVHEMGSLR
jgi:hypothetical protein